MDYYKKKILLINTISNSILTILLLLPFFFLALLINYNCSYIGAKLSISFIPSFIYIRILKRFIFIRLINKIIINAPNPRKMYWKLRLLSDNFTKKYPTIPEFTDNNVFIPETKIFRDRITKNVRLNFRKDRITVFNKFGKYITIKNEDINEIKISAKFTNDLRYVQTYIGFEVYYNANKKKEQTYIGSSIDYDIDELDQFIEKYKNDKIIKNEN